MAKGFLGLVGQAEAVDGLFGFRLVNHRRRRREVNGLDQMAWYSNRHGEALPTERTVVSLPGNDLRDQQLLTTVRTANPRLGRLEHPRRFNKQPSNLAGHYSLGAAFLPDPVIPV